MNDKSMFRNILATYGFYAVALVAGMLTSVIVARTLGPEGKGQVALLILVPATVMAFGDLGIRQSSTYVMARGKPR